MSSFNQAIVIGNLGNDPETRYSGGGMAMTTISIATSESWKDKQTGEKKERTTWHRVKMFGSLAEVASQYLRKGSKVMVQGPMRVDEYEKDGIKRYDHYIIANEMKMLSPRQEDDGQQRGRGQGRDQGHGQGDQYGGRYEGRGPQGGGRSADHGSVRGEPRGGNYGPGENGPVGGGLIDDDDIPFN